MPARLVSFDLDGVLIQNPFRECVLPRLRDIVRAAPSLRELPQDEADRRMAQAVGRVWRKLQRQGEWVLGYDWDHVYGLAAADLGVPELPAVVPIVEACCADGEGFHLLPHASEALDLLADEGLRMVAITNNFAAVQAPVLRALGIAHRFDAVLGPDVLGTAKPDPAVFHGLGEVVAHVGDTLSTDVAAARRAGVRSIWIVRGEDRRAALSHGGRSTLSRDEWRSAWSEDPYADLYPPLDPALRSADAATLTALDAARLALHWTRPS